MTNEATCGFAQSSPPTASSRPPYRAVPVKRTSFVTTPASFCASSPFCEVALTRNDSVPFVVCSTAASCAPGISNRSCDEVT